MSHILRYYTFLALVLIAVLPTISSSVIKAHFDLTKALIDQNKDRSVKESENYVSNANEDTHRGEAKVDCAIIPESKIRISYFIMFNRNKLIHRKQTESLIEPRIMTKYHYTSKSGLPDRNKPSKEGRCMDRIEVRAIDEEIFNRKKLKAPPNAYKGPIARECTADTVCQDDNTSEDFIYYCENHVTLEDGKLVPKGCKCEYGHITKYELEILLSQSHS